MQVARSVVHRVFHRMVTRGTFGPPIPPCPSSPLRALEERTLKPTRRGYRGPQSATDDMRPFDTGPAAVSTTSLESLSITPRPGRPAASGHHPLGGRLQAGDLPLVRGVPRVAVDLVGQTLWRLPTRPVWRYQLRPVTSARSHRTATRDDMPRPWIAPLELSSLFERCCRYGAIRWRATEQPKRAWAGLLPPPARSWLARS